MGKRSALLLAVFAAIALPVAGCSGSVPIPRERPLSAAEKQRLLDADQQTDLDELRAQYPGADPGRVAFKHFVHTRDWPSTMSSCMLAAGFRTSVDTGGITYSDLPAQQQQPYALALYRCGREYPIDPMDSAPLSAAELKFLYGYVSGTLSKCLRTHGIAVPNPPSEQTFADAYPSTGGWDPYSSATDVSKAQWAKLVKECPPEPAGFRGN